MIPSLESSSKSCREGSPATYMYRFILRAPPFFSLLTDGLPAQVLPWALFG